MNPLYVDMDVSSKSNVVSLMLPNGDKHSTFSVANSKDGVSQMVKRIRGALVSHSLDTVIIGLEATSVYGDHLVYFLREDATLAPFHRSIHVLNPKQVRNFKQAYNDLPKNDRVDSFVIAEIGDIHRFPNQTKLGKYAVLAWTQHQSGDFQSQTTRLIQSGNRFLKYYLCEATWSLVKCDTEYRSFYHSKYKEVNRHQHKCALA